MSLRQYASKDDYVEQAEDLWDGADEVLEKRLRMASVEVDTLTRLSVFPTDTDGIPTDPAHLDAFKAATCAIVEYWTETDDPTGADAYAGAVKIGSVSLGTTSSSSDGLTAREKLQRRIGTRAIDILANAGLITPFVTHT